MSVPRGAAVGVLVALVAAAAHVAGRAAADGVASRPSIAYARHGGLFTVNDDGSAPRRLIAPHSRVESFDWSPDGGRIVVARPGAGLSVLLVGTRTLKRLTKEPLDGPPDWSPNGRRIVFGRGDYGEIWTVSPAGTAARRVIQAYDAYAPRWSPDSRRIAFDWDAGDSYNAVAVVNADGRGRINVGTDGDNVWGPTWSPDGTRIAFTRERIPKPGEPASSHGANVWLMNSDGSDQRPLIADAGADGSDQERPAWSPDGGRIAFESGGQVDVVDIDGSRQTTLAADAYAPQWSPDGSEIAFARLRGKVIDLFVMKADGSNPHRVAAGPVAAFAWKPN